MYLGASDPGGLDQHVTLGVVEGEGHCCSPPPLEAGGIIQLAAEVPAGFARYIEKLAREMWDKKATEAGFDPELVKAYGDRLSEAVTKGYGKDIFAIDWNEPDYEKLKHLHIDAWKFATGKSEEHLDMLTRALRKPDGSMRTFEEFRVQTVIATDKQLRGLRAEYNTAIASAQMAAKWERIQATKGSFPYLEYVAVMDNHVTDKCARLDGVIRHVDDPFWKQYYPPNHYNCRSTVKQLRQIPEGYKDPFEEPNLPEQFKTDFIMQGHLFPADHKYYGLAPNELFNKVREHLPYDLQFDEYATEEVLAGKVRVHFKAERDANDFQRVLDSSIEFGRRGHLADIMPSRLGDEKKYDNKGLYNTLFKSLTGTIYEGREPDIHLDRVMFIEHEGFTGPIPKNQLKNMLNRGTGQSSNIIIDQPDLTDRNIIRNIMLRIHAEGQKIDNVWVLNNGQLRLIFTKTPKP